MRKAITALGLATVVLCGASAQTSTSTPETAPPDSPLGALLAQHIVPPHWIPLRCKSVYMEARPHKIVSGKTIVAFKIMADGSVEDVRIEQSSGSEFLDRQTVECISQRHYQPATKDGQPIEVPWKVVVDWRAARS